MPYVSTALGRLRAGISPSPPRPPQSRWLSPAAIHYPTPVPERWSRGLQAAAPGRAVAGLSPADWSAASRHQPGSLTAPPGSQATLRAKVSPSLLPSALGAPQQGAATGSKSLEGLPENSGWVSTVPSPLMYDSGGCWLPLMLSGEGRDRPHGSNRARSLTSSVVRCPDGSLSPTVIPRA